MSTQTRMIITVLFMSILLTGCGNPTLMPTSTPSPTQTPPPTSAPAPTTIPTLMGNGGGVIAFASLEGNEWQIHIMNADGSGQKQVTVGVKGGYEPNWSPDGTKIVFQYGGIWIADIATGEISRIPLSVKSNNLPNEYLVKPSWSPDGEWIAFLNENGTRGDIYLIRPDGTDLRRLTDSNDISRDGDLVWSPDGKQFAYSAYRGGTIEIFVMDVEGALQGGAASQQLTDSPAPVRNLVTSWSPDGSRLAFSSDRDGNTEIYLMNVDGSNVVRLTNNPASDTQPDWSPDGKQIAFSSNRDGNVEIYVLDVEDAIQSADDANVRRLTNHPSDDMGPVWMPTTAPVTDTHGASPYAGWIEYVDSGYGFKFRYPPEWTDELDLRSDSTTYQHLIWLRAPSKPVDGVQMMIAFERVGENFGIQRTGIGAGELIERGEVTFLGEPAKRIVLVLEGKDMEVMYGATGAFERGDLRFAISLSYVGVERLGLTPELEQLADLIVASFELIQQ